MHDTALISDVLNVMNMDISSWTAITKYPLQEHWCHITKHTETTTPDQALDTTERTEKEETGPDLSLDTADITAPAAMTCTETTPDHNNGMGTATIEATQDNPIQDTEDTATAPAKTHHTSNTAKHLHTTAHQVTILRTTVDHILAHPTGH